MRTLDHHAAIMTHLASINSRIVALAHSFKELEPRNTADSEIIALMLQRSAALTEAAQGLLTIAYDPTPVDPEPAP